MGFVRAAALAEVREKGRSLFRLGKRQIALFAVGDGVYAVDNRCPHEGYPLLQGSVDPERCLLTCQWHNWKFELPTGECVLGEDHVRSYPTRIEEGFVEVDITDPPVERIEAETIRGLEGAIRDRQYGRIAREISRLLVNGIDPLHAVRRAVELTYDKLEFGTTHAYAATADWIALYGDEDDLERKVICLTEAVDHIADDALRHPAYPYAEERHAFDGASLLASIEAEDETRATALGRGAKQWREIEPWLARAAFAHYNDFGHAAIYVQKTGALMSQLGPQLTEKLVLPLTRMLTYSTREDLLPDFKPYAELDSELREITGTGTDWIDGAALSGLSIKEALEWVAEHSSHHRPEVLHSALLEAGAANLLRFDASFASASKPSVSQNVGWLDFTHALTFGSAVLELCGRYPELWPRALLQMACFVGRNKRFLTPQPAEVEAAIEDARSLLFDHGLSDPIFSAHLVKTYWAVIDQGPHVSPSCRRHLDSALTRFLGARVKEKHPLRTARQALSLVAASSP